MNLVERQKGISCFNATKCSTSTFVSRVPNKRSKKKGLKYGPLNFSVIHIKKNRKFLYGQLKEEREKKCSACIKNNKLIVNGEEYTFKRLKHL